MPESGKGGRSRSKSPTTKPAKKEAPKKKPRDPDAPKKPLVGYMKFAKETRPQIVKDSPGLSFAEIGRALGAAWRELTDEEKAKYS